MSENFSITRLENRYMQKQRRKLYIALEELDFTWSDEEVKQVIKMWKRNTPLIEIADHFNRMDEEVAVLIMDLSMKDKIKPREVGI